MLDRPDMGRKETIYTVHSLDGWISPYLDRQRQVGGGCPDRRPFMYLYAPGIGGWEMQGRAGDDPAVLSFRTDAPWRSVQDSGRAVFYIRARDPVRSRDLYPGSAFKGKGRDGRC